MKVICNALTQLVRSGMLSFFRTIYTALISIREYKSRTQLLKLIRVHTSTGSFVVMGLMLETCLHLMQYLANSSFDGPLAWAPHVYTPQYS